MKLLEKYLWIIECASTDRVLGYFYSTLYTPNNFYAYDMKSVANSFDCEYLTYEKPMIRALSFEELTETQRESYTEDIISGRVIRLVNSEAYLVPMYLHDRYNS